MPRMPRLVVPGFPHHITQRGSRRQRTFFDDSDFLAYLDLIRSHKVEAGVEIWAYCLMPNHVHLVAVPDRPDALCRLMRVVHHRHALRVNAARGWRGHLWQERFHSFVMDQEHLLAAVRYIELNPVRAGLCQQADAWRWSSSRAYLSGKTDGVVNVRPLLAQISDWRTYLSLQDSPQTISALRSHSNTGRPAGSADFIFALELISSRILRKGKTGPKPARENNSH